MGPALCLVLHMLTLLTSHDSVWSQRGPYLRYDHGQPCFIDEGMEEQGGKVLCSRAHGWEVVSRDLNIRILNSESKCLDILLHL